VWKNEHRYYYPELKDRGINKECTDFSTPKNFPYKIVKLIKAGKMSRIGICLDVLNKEGKKAYEKVKAPAWEAYEKVKDEANKLVAECLGKCYHEWNYKKVNEGTDKRSFFVIHKSKTCIKCDLEEDNIDYLNSAEGLKEMLEYLLKKHEVIIYLGYGNIYEIKKYGDLSGEFITLSENKNLNLALAIAILGSKVKLEE